MSEQTVSKSWQSSTWLVDNRNEGPTRFYLFIYLTELLLLRNEIIVAVRKKIYTSPSSMVAPRSPRGCELHPSKPLISLVRSQVTFSAPKYPQLCWREGQGKGGGGEIDVVVSSIFWKTHIFRDW